MILHIEDSMFDVKLLNLAAEKARFDFTFLTIKDGEEAINYIDNLKPHGVIPRLFIVDFQLPKKSGLDIITKIKSTELLKTLPVILFTATYPNDEIKRCCELGAVYVSKPSDIEGYERFLGLLSTFLKTTA